MVSFILNDLIQFKTNSFQTPLKFAICNCRDKGPGSYVGPWAQSKDVEWFEKGQIVIRGSNPKFHK